MTTSWLIVCVPRLEFVDPCDFDDARARLSALMALSISDSGDDLSLDRATESVATRWAPELADGGVHAVSSDGRIAAFLPQHYSWYVSGIAEPWRRRVVPVELDELVQHCGPGYCGRVRVCSPAGLQSGVPGESRGSFQVTLLPTFGDLMEAQEGTGSAWSEAFLRVDRAGLAPRLPPGHAVACSHHDLAFDATAGLGSVSPNTRTE